MAQNMKLLHSGLALAQSALVAATVSMAFRWQQHDGEDANDSDPGIQGGAGGGVRGGLDDGGGDGAGVHAHGDPGIHDGGDEDGWV